jgi:hypothetical protein
MSTLNERAGKALAGRWRPGMVDTEGRRVTAADGPVRQYAVPVAGRYYPTTGVASGGAPDMSDPATRGAFLDVVREAWGDPLIFVSCSEWWTVESPNWPATRNASFSGLTEAEALVAALESAPR